MRKKLLSLLLFLIIAGTLTSCASAVTMTDEQTDLAAEYISSIILKYNQKDTSSKLVKLEEAEAAEEDPKVDPVQEDNSEITHMDGNETKQEDIPNKETTDKKDVTLEALYGLTDVSITYNHVKEYTSYPADSKEALTAKDGYKFLAVGFTIANHSDQDVSVDLLKSNVAFSMKVNDSDWIPAMHTLLPNDMTYYQGKIKSGKTKEAVVLFEVKKSFQLSNAIFFALSDSKKAYEVTIK